MLNLEKYLVLSLLSGLFISCGDAKHQEQTSQVETREIFGGAPETDGPSKDESKDDKELPMCEVSYHKKTPDGPSKDDPKQNDGKDSPGQNDDVDTDNGQNDGDDTKPTDPSDPKGPSKDDDKEKPTKDCEPKADESKDGKGSEGEYEKF